MSPNQTQAHVPPPRRRRKAGLWVLVSVTLVLAATALTLWAAVGRPVTAPDWLRARIEARLAEALPGVQVQFGEVGVQVERSGLARVRLGDVDIATTRGAPIAALSDVEAALSLGALLRGQVSLREARLSGAFVTLKRDAKGRLGLALGQDLGTGQAAPDLPTLIAQVDRLLADPRLADLREVTADALTLRFEDARARRGWTADGGRLSVAREGGTLRLRGDFAVLGGSDTAATLALSAESVIGRTSVDFGLTFTGLPSGDIATQSPALAWLNALRAPISGALRGGLDGAGGLAPLSATLQIGAGVLQPNDRTRAVPFQSARTYFTYEPAEARLQFAEISVDSDLGAAHAEGSAVMQGLERGWPTAMLGQFTLTGLEADPGAFLAGPVQVARAEMDFRLELAPFRLSLGRMRIDDPDLPLRMQGTLDAREDGWHLALDGQVARARPEQVGAYWPPAVAPRTRNWFLENISGGEARDVQMALRAVPETRPQLYLDLAFEGVTARYARTLPPVIDGAGQFTLIDNRMSVMVDAGRMTPPEGGDVDLAGSQFVIPDTRVKPARAKIALSAQSSVTAALSFLDQEPLTVLKRAGRPVDLAQGQARLTGRLALPLKRGIRLPDMDFDIAGALSDLRSEAVVPNRVLSAEALTLNVTPRQVRISGVADLSGVPFEGSWTQPLGQPGAGSVVAGDVTLSPDSIAALGLQLPRGMVTGRGRGALTIELGPGGAPRYRLTSTLAGVGLSLPPVAWSLAQGTTGRLEVAGTLGAAPTVERLELEGAGLRAAGRVLLAPGGGLDRVELGRVQLGGWLDAPVTLSAREPGLPPAVTIRGGRLDLRQAPNGSGGGGDNGPGAPLSVTLDSLQISDGITLSGFRGEFITQGGLQGDFIARLGPKSPIRGQLVPQNGRSAVRIAADDAGRVFGDAGLLKTVQGGTLVLNLVPVRGVPGHYDGALDARDVRLRNAPAIGALLDAISVVGLLDQLNGPGIYFAQVDARFRLTPSQVILSRSSATGPSMGISMDGYYNLASRQLDMQGVISPIYILNSIGSLFTRKGEGLIGFNFNLSGPTSDPRVAVNPLSVFTPGMFREIFRRPPPQPQQAPVQQAPDQQATTE